VRSGAYAHAIGARDPSVKLSALACPLFVPLAEEGWVDDDIAMLVARKYLVQLFDQDREIDTLVLGCTHYPILAGVIGRVARDLAGRPIQVVDSANAMAESAREALGSAIMDQANRRTAPGTLDCYATDTSRLDEIAPRFLGEPISRFELVDL
jgi:glutamate racemase